MEFEKTMIEIFDTWETYDMIMEGAKSYGRKNGEQIHSIMKREKSLRP